MSLEQQVSDYLAKWATQLKEAKRSHFRVSAVKKASDIVLTVPLKALADADSLKSIKGIGPEIEAVIKEIVSTGKCVEIDNVASGSKTLEETSDGTTPKFYYGYDSAGTKQFGSEYVVFIITEKNLWDKKKKWDDSANFDEIFKLLTGLFGNRLIGEAMENVQMFTCSRADVENALSVHPLFAENKKIVDSSIW